MSSEKSGYPSSYRQPPAYPEGDAAPTAPPAYSTGAPASDYPDTGNRAGAYQPAGAPTTPYTNQYLGNYNTQYGQQSNVQVVQRQPGMMVMQRNPAAGEAYSGLFIGSIIVTLLCCWPIGIFAINRARQAKTSAELGRPAEAEGHADAAKRLMIAAVVGGIIAIGIIIAITVVRIQAINSCTGYRC